MAELREKFKSIFDHSPTSSRGVFQVLKSTTRSNPKPKMEPTRRSDRIKLKENIPVYLEENVESKRKSKIKVTRGLHNLCAKTVELYLSLKIH